MKLNPANIVRLPLNLIDPELQLGDQLLDAAALSTAPTSMLTAFNVGLQEAVRAALGQKAAADVMLVVGAVETTIDVVMLVFTFAEGMYTVVRSCTSTNVDPYTVAADFALDKFAKLKDLCSIVERGICLTSGIMQIQG